MRFVCRIRTPLLRWLTKVWARAPAFRSALDLHLRAATAAYLARASALPACRFVATPTPNSLVVAKTGTAAPFRTFIDALVITASAAATAIF